jgi:hypothetical protein
LELRKGGDCFTQHTPHVILRLDQLLIVQRLQ